MLRDESFHPLEFDHHLFFNKDSENPLPSYWITSNAHPIIEPVGFLCNSFSSCLSCLSCLSMFPNAANRINGTWSLLATGHKDPLFHPRMIRPVVGGRGPGLPESKHQGRLLPPPQRRGLRPLIVQCCRACHGVRRCPNRHRRWLAGGPPLLSFPLPGLGLSGPRERAGCGRDVAGPKRLQILRLARGASVVDDAVGIEGRGFANSTCHFLLLFDR